MDSGSAQEYDVFTSTLSGSSDSASAVGWLGDAGTSAASPIWAGLIAIADQGRALAGGTPLTGNTQTLPALYSLPSTDFHDIVNGNNGDPAGPGYDLASGLGTPIANLLVPALASYDLVSKSSTSIAVQASPKAPVFGQPITLTVTVTAGTGVPTGSVTFEQGSTVLGTATLDNGVATFATTPTAAGPLALTIAYGGDTNDKATSTTFSVTVGQAAATLTLGNLNATYNSLPHTASVTTDPAGLSGVTVTYSQNGVTVTNPIQAGDYTVTASLSNPNYTAPEATGTLIISQATATLGLSNLSVTYDGSPQNAVATTNPAGISGVTISYAQNGVPVTNPTQEGDYSVTATLSNPNYTAPAATGTLVIGPATTTLKFSGLNDTYDGSPQFAQVTTGLGKLAGITVTYAQNGVAVAAPTQAGDYQVTATLTNPNVTAPAATATLVIGQATPTVAWSAPANITVGTALSSTQLDATATFDGASLPGALDYTPAMGTVLPAGNSQSLLVSFTPADTTDYKTVSASVPISVLPQSTTPPPPEQVKIIGEAPVFSRKLNKKGKPTGKAVLTGFTLEYSALTRIGRIESGELCGRHRHDQEGQEESRSPGAPDQGFYCYQHTCNQFRDDQARRHPVVPNRRPDHSLARRDRPVKRRAQRPDRLQDHTRRQKNPADLSCRGLAWTFRQSGHARHAANGALVNSQGREPLVCWRDPLQCNSALKRAEVPLPGVRQETVHGVACEGETR